MINQAALRGSADSHDSVTMEDLEYAKDKIIMGQCVQVYTCVWVCVRVCVWVWGCGGVYVCINYVRTVHMKEDTYVYTNIHTYVYTVVCG